MRVTHFISGDLWAGAEAMVYQLLREQHADPDIQVSAFLLNDGALAAKLRRASISLDVQDERHSSFFSILFRARANVAQQRPDIIHSHRIKENILAYLASRGRRKVRLLATQHGLPETPSRSVFSVASLNLAILRHRFDLMVGVSGTVQKHFLSTCAFRGDRLTFIHNGVDLPDLTTEEVVDSELRVGSAGRLFPVKDYPLMVEIANCVAKEDPASRFELIGDGPERSNIEQMVRHHRLGSIFSMPGHRDDISDFYSRINVYLNTSEHEGIPMSILEAMAHGLPVVAPDVGGIGEIIDDGVDGFLVSGRDPDAFVEPILQLQDAALRARIGKAARKKIEQSFSARHMANQYLTLYRQLLS